MTAFDYDSIPPGYYHKVMTEGNLGHRFWHREKFNFVAQAVPSTAEVLLDVGCGPGSFFHVLRQSRSDMTLVGCDLSLPQLEYGAEMLAGEAHWFSADATRLPLGDDSVDVITMVEVLEHFPPGLEAQVLSEFRRVLKKGGKLIMTTPNYRSHWPLIEWLWDYLSPVKYEDQHLNCKNLVTLSQSLRRAGFTVKSIRSFFVLAPFIAMFSVPLANAILKWEQQWLSRVGAICLVEGGL